MMKRKGKTDRLIDEKPPNPAEETEEENQS